MTTITDDPDGIGWDVRGWDWPDGDWSWLSSHSGRHYDGKSVFFIHGGKIKEQAHIPHRSYTLDEFVAVIRDRMQGLDDPRIEWCEDTGGGDKGLWVEGTRAPNDDDRARLRLARERQTREDRNNLRSIRQRHPEWFD